MFPLSSAHKKYHITEVIKDVRNRSSAYIQTSPFYFVQGDLTFFSSLPLFDPVISFPTQSTELSLYSIGSQALGFPAGWRSAGVLNVGKKVVEYMSKLCATVTKILNRDNLGKGFLLTQVLTLSACAVAPIAFGLSGGKTS